MATGEVTPPHHGATRGHMDTQSNQSFPEYAAETLGRLLDGLMTEREFATAIARAAAGEMPFTDAATDEYFVEEEAAVQ